MIGVRLHEPLLTEISEWAKANGVTDPEAIRQLVEAGLKATRDT